MTRIFRLLSVPILLVGLVSPLVAQEDKKSQNPNDAQFGPQTPVEVPDEGTALYGYLAFGFLAGVTMFALCRSSRRS